MNNHQGNNQTLYTTQAIGGSHNIQLLDNMFQIPVSEQPGVSKATIVQPQYAYATDVQLSTAPQHAVNLAQAHVVTTATSSEIAPGQQVLIYQQGSVPISSAPQTSSAQTLVAEDKKKDIVAEAASKIFEDMSGNKKQQQPVPVTQSATPTANPLPTAIKSEPTQGPSSSTTTPPSSAVKTPSSSQQQKASIRTGGPISVGRPRGGGSGPRGGGVSHFQRQQILPRLQLLEDEDDGLTCRLCLQSFWYKSNLIEHLRTTHSIADPERYEREEREKKMRRIREEQQRQILAKRQRLAAAGRGVRGRFRGARMGAALPKQPSGPRPSFQYRDGAFICDLCKKSFSDGNDMVLHWKSHVKKQRLSGPARGGRRGRPPKEYSYSSDEGRSRSRGGRGGRSDKGKPRWTAYLVWSTRRRKEIAEEEPDLSFAEVAKNISVEWKEISEEEKEKYQEEADEMNATGQRKLRKEREYNSDEWSSEDPDFEEFDDVKPIMLKIKKDGESSTPRSQRQRKRPSFFQEFENEENNLDKILDEFEQEQMEEAKKPKPERKTITPRPEGSAPRRRRKREKSPDEPEEEIELEQTRSGRIRKKRKIVSYSVPDEEDSEDDEAGDDSEDRDDYQPDESEPDEPPEEYVEEVSEDSEVESDDSLVKKKKSLMTDEEIEEARRKAKARIKFDDDEEFDSEYDSDSESDDFDEDLADEEDESSEGIKRRKSNLEIAKAKARAEKENKKDQEKEGESSKDTENESKQNDDETKNAPEAEKEKSEAEEKTAEVEDVSMEVTAEPAEGQEQELQGVVEEEDVAPESNEEIVPANESAAAPGGEENPVPTTTAASGQAVDETSNTEPQQSEEKSDIDALMASDLDAGDAKFKDIMEEGQMDQIFQ